MRNLFVVPAQDVTSPEIEALEEEAATSADAKMQLNALLHVSGGH